MHRDPEFHIFMLNLESGAPDYIFFRLNWAPELYIFTLILEMGAPEPYIFMLNLKNEAP